MELKSGLSWQMPWQNFRFKPSCETQVLSAHVLIDVT
jgi:hypothetical protein